MSLRLESALHERLASAAAAEGTSVTALVEQFIREGLDLSRHPGIMFKTGPSGRRAALAGGPDIWEIASALRHTHGSERERISALAAEFGVHEREISIALNYAAANRADIDARIQANDRALDEAERTAIERTKLLA